MFKKRPILRKLFGQEERYEVYENITWVQYEFWTGETVLKDEKGEETILRGVISMMFDDSFESGWTEVKAGYMIYAFFSSAICTLSNGGLHCKETEKIRG